MATKISKTLGTKNYIFSNWFESNRKNIHQTYAAVVASLTYFAIGEIRSWSSSGIPSLQGKDGKNATLSQGPLHKETTSWITSGPPLGAILSALIAGFVLQKYGRKITLLISVAVTVVAFIILATVKIFEVPNVMIACRTCMGITVGFSMPSAAIYISECTDAKIRGLLGSLPAVFMALGISYGYLLGTFLPWHILSYVFAGVPLLTFIGILFTPESPHWLFANSKIDEAENAYRWLNGGKLQQPNTLSSLLSSVPKKDEVEKEETIHFMDEMKTKPVWHPFILCLIIMAFQQWSGVNAVIFNTVTIFHAANVTIDQYLATNIVGAVQLIATFLSILIIDKAGRRILLLISGIIMAITMCSTGTFFYMFSNTEDPNVLEIRDRLEWLPLLSLIIYMIGYSFGFACVPFLLIGEMLPARMKNLLGGAVSSFNLCMTFLVLKFFPTIAGGIGYHGLFWIYACVSLVGGIFGYVCIPETKGKTLKEIEAHFGGLEKVQKNLSLVNELLIK